MSWNTLYATDDVKRQFGISARSRLTPEQIDSIPRALRNLDRKKRLGGDVVAAAGEILGGPPIQCDGKPRPAHDANGSLRAHAILSGSIHVPVFASQRRGSAVRAVADDAGDVMFLDRDTWAWDIP